MRSCVIALVALLPLALLTGCSDEPAEGQCADQTSHDHNWHNDMLCKRSDGSTFETDYAGADEFEANN